MTEGPGRGREGPGRGGSGSPWSWHRQSVLSYFVLSFSCATCLPVVFPEWNSMHPPVQESEEAARRHELEVARLREAILRVERSERQMLKAKAVLEGRISELEAGASQFEARVALIRGECEERAAEAERRAAAAAQAAQGEAARRVGELQAERDALVQRAAVLEARLGR